MISDICRFPVCRRRNLEIRVVDCSKLSGAISYAFVNGGDKVSRRNTQIRKSVELLFTRWALKRRQTTPSDAGGEGFVCKAGRYVNTVFSSFKLRLERRRSLYFLCASDSQISLHSLCLLHLCRVCAKPDGKCITICNRKIIFVWQNCVHWI